MFNGKTKWLIYAPCSVINDRDIFDSSQLERNLSLGLSPDIRGVSTYDYSTIHDLSQWFTEKEKFFVVR